MQTGAGFIRIIEHISKGIYLETTTNTRQQRMCRVIKAITVLKLLKITLIHCIIFPLLSPFYLYTFIFNCFMNQIFNVQCTLIIIIYSVIYCRNLTCYRFRWNSLNLHNVSIICR